MNGGRFKIERYPCAEPLFRVSEYIEPCDNFIVLPRAVLDSVFDLRIPGRRPTVFRKFLVWTPTESKKQKKCQPENSFKPLRRSSLLHFQTQQCSIQCCKITQTTHLSARKRPLRRYSRQRNPGIRFAELRLLRENVPPNRGMHFRSNSMRPVKAILVPQPPTTFTGLIRFLFDGKIRTLCSSSSKAGRRN